MPSISALWASLLGTLGTDHELVPPAPLDTASALSALLADLNPNDTTLGAAIPALGSQVGELLNTIFIGSTPIGSLPIDTLAGDLLGESATSATIQSLLDSLGLGQLRRSCGRDQELQRHLARSEPESLPIR